MSPSRTGVTRGRMTAAVLLFVAAVGAVLLALEFFATGFAGPAPIVLAAGGMCIAAGVAMLRNPPRERRPLVTATAYEQTGQQREDLAGGHEVEHPARADRAGDRAGDA